jgi:hypothetical protein
MPLALFDTGDLWFEWENGLHLIDHTPLPASSADGAIEQIGGGERGGGQSGVCVPPRLYRANVEIVL